MNETIEEAEFEEVHLPAVREVGVANLFGAADPVAVIEQAERVATALANVIEQKGLFKMISGRKHVVVEGWTLLGAMVGVFPVTEWSRPVTDWAGKPGWEARVAAQTRQGEIVGTREAMCSRGESKWEKKDDYAIRSMAQTRAVSGALSSPLRFIMELAGYSGTPEAEMHTAGIPEVRVEGPTTPAPKSYAELELGFRNLNVDTIWLEQAALVWRDMHDGSKGGTFQMLQSAYVRLAERQGSWPGGDFLSPPRSVIREVFASVLGGFVLEGPDHRIGYDETAETCPERPAGPSVDLTPDLTDEEMSEAERIADEAIQGAP